MKTRVRWIVVIVLTLSAFLFVFNCSSTTGPNVDGGTNTGDAQVLGRVYLNEGGILRFADSASVAFLKLGLPPDSIEETAVTTDDSGFYFISWDSPLDSGTYNITAEKSGLKAFVSNALKTSLPPESGAKPTDTVPPIILDITGSISGIVQLQPFHDNSLAYILLMGTKRYTRADTGGFFHFDSLAAGMYEIHIIAEPDGYVPFDTTVTILPGEEVALEDTIRLEFYTLVPVVDDVSVSFDRATMTALLKWRPAGPRTEGYNIYRGTDFMLMKRVATLTADDSSFSDDLIHHEGLRLNYSVAAIDSNGNVGPQSEKATVGVRSALSSDTATAVEYREYIVSNVFIPELNVHYATDGWSLMKLNEKGTLITSTSLSFHSTVEGNNYLEPVTIVVDSNAFIYIYYAYNAPSMDTSNAKRNIDHIDKFDSDLRFIRSYEFELLRGLSPRDIALGSNGRLFISQWMGGLSRIYRLDTLFAISSLIETYEDIYQIYAFNDTLTAVYRRPWKEMRGGERNPYRARFYNFQLDSLGEFELNDFFTSLPEVVADTAFSRIYRVHNGTIMFYFGEGKWTLFDTEKNLIARFITKIEGNLICIGDSTIYRFRDGYLYKHSIIPE